MLKASSLHVTAKGDLEGSDLGSGSSSSISSLPRVPDSIITPPEDNELRGLEIEDELGDFESQYRRWEGESVGFPKYRYVPKFEDKTNLSKYHHHLYQQTASLQPHVSNHFSLSSHGPSTLPRMGHDRYGPASTAIASPAAGAGKPYDQAAPHYSSKLQNPNYGGYYSHEQFSYSHTPGEMINIKERSFPISNAKLKKSPSRVKSGKRVHFVGLQTVEEDGPIPCNPIDCPEARLALENARLAHSLPLELAPFQSRQVSYASSSKHYPVKISNTDTSPKPNESSGTPTNGYAESIRALPFSDKKKIMRTPCSVYANSEPPLTSYRPRLPLSSLRFAYRQPQQTQYIAEVEGDNTFPSQHHDQSGLVPSIASLGIYSSVSPHPSPNDRFSSVPSWPDLDIGGPQRNVNALEPISDYQSKKPKEIFKKLLGGRQLRAADVGLSPFVSKLEGNQTIRYGNLDTRKEWAFVAISPDSKTIIGVCDHEVFITYSIEIYGTRVLVCGEFEGAPLAIAVSNTHLAILTLTKLQIFDHRIGRKVYEHSSDKSVISENFTSITFANNGLELCAGMTNGKIQFHYIPAENREFNPEDMIFLRGDPMMDINLSSGDYAFTMSFSKNDIKFACGTQKRMLLVYEFRGATGWELRNKFKFNDWEPGTHRRISGAIFCPDDRFLFATTTSGRSSAYMRCIDDNKQPNCSQSVSYALPITKKGVTRSAMSPNGKAIALIDGDGTVYKCEFNAGPVLSDRQEFAKLPGTLIPARACWVSWTDSGDLILLDKKGHIRVFEAVAVGRSPS
ncbi:hypothetical protein TWF694_008839 [Orbilia ellipsospora]|uniref:Uncharacterized protein n=1 Tax=Orbilia ellipsospora TaxID=2528407 RepID=A0AAV9XEL1_9PEZI